MKSGLIVALIGSIVLGGFVFVNAGLFLTGPTGSDYVALACLLAIAAIIGALPGLIIARVAHNRRSNPRG